MIKKLILLLFLTATLNSSAQTYLTEKRIYLLDVTASMNGKGAVETPDIFDEVKRRLQQSILNLQASETEVVIIPFTKHPFETIEGRVSNADSLATEIGKIKIQKGDTNIADAWNAGVAELDSTKVNYLFLLTDGLHNCGPSADSLYNRLATWKDISDGKYMFSFYVMLTPNAKDMEITKIIEETENMWPIESMDVNVSFINTSLHYSANVNNNKAIRIFFTSNNSPVFDSELQFDIELESNPYYGIKKINNNIQDRYIEFELEELLPRIDLPIECNLKLSFVYDKKKYPLTFFTPEAIDLHIVNKGIRTMNIREK